MSVIVHRNAARAILLTPEREVLLMRIPAGRRRSILDYARRRYRGQRKPGARFQAEEEIGFDAVEVAQFFGDANTLLISATSVVARASNILSFMPRAFIPKSMMLRKQWF
jgi:hypothetical protein